MTQTVVVKHDAALSSPAALVAALNGAMLDASLTPPRAQALVRPVLCCAGGSATAAACTLHARLPLLAAPLTPPARNNRLPCRSAAAGCHPGTSWPEP